MVAEKREGRIDDALGFEPDAPIRRRDIPIGCVGAGFIMADVQLAACAEAGSPVVALASRAVEVAERWGVARVHDTPRALIAAGPTTRAAARRRGASPRATPPAASGSSRAGPRGGSRRRSPVSWSSCGSRSAPGLGSLDYDAYLRLLPRKHPNISLIIEHLEEADVPRAKQFIDGRLRANGA